MASQYTHDIVATVGEYTNGAGEKKKRYTTVGAAFTDEQGRVSLKMETIPVTPNWSGWLSLYPRKERNVPNGAQSNNQSQQPAQAADEDNGEDIPF